MDVEEAFDVITNETLSVDVKQGDHPSENLSTEQRPNRIPLQSPHFVPMAFHDSNMRGFGNNANAPNQSFASKTRSNSTQDHSTAKFRCIHQAIAPIYSSADEILRRWGFSERSFDSLPHGLCKDLSHCVEWTRKWNGFATEWTDNRVRIPVRELASWATLCFGPSIVALFEAIAFHHYNPTNVVEIRFWQHITPSLQTPHYFPFAHDNGHLTTKTFVSTPDTIELYDLQKSTSFFIPYRELANQQNITHDQTNSMNLGL